MLLLFMSYIRWINIIHTALIRARYLMWVSVQPTGYVPFTLLLGFYSYGESSSYLAIPVEPGYGE